MRKRPLAGKQAKTLSAAQIRTALSYLATTRNAERDVVMFLLRSTFSRPAVINPERVAD